MRVFTTIRSLTRLTIGGISLGIDVLSNRLERWENTIEENGNEHDIFELELTTYLDDELNGMETDNANIEIVNPSDTVIVYHETTDDLVKYTVLGLIFTWNDLLENTFQKLDKITRDVSNTITYRLEKYDWFGPLNKKYNKLVLRGSKVLYPIKERGENEYKRSRLLAYEALNDTYQDMLNSLSESEEVQDLIQDHSVGLATEVVEEVRERSVSADNLLDALAQRIFRLKDKKYYTITEYTDIKTNAESEK